MNKDIQTQKDIYLELEVKYNELNEMITKSKEFKQGASEYDRMVTRISKLESELELYKKVLQKAERDAKKEKE